MNNNSINSIPWECASTLMDMIALVQLCGQGFINEDETRNIFTSICDRYNINLVTDIPED